MVDSKNNKPIYDSAFVDKIFVDIDEPSEWEKVKLINKNLIENNILHTIVFSGKGFHIYIFVNEVDGGVAGWVKKEAIVRWVDENLVKKYDLKVDRVVIGDLARITRIPNTFNFKRGRFCVPLTSKQMNMSYEEICNFAKKQNFEWEFFGRNLVSLNVNNVKREIREFDRNVNLDELENKYKNWLNVITSKIEWPPFLQKIIEKHKKYWDRAEGWRDRFLIIVWLKENGVSYEECILILKNILTREEFVHCVFEEQQPYHIYKRDLTKDPYFFPTIQQLKNYYDLTEEDINFLLSHPLYLSEEDLDKLEKEMG